MNIYTITGLIQESQCDKPSLFDDLVKTNKPDQEVPDDDISIAFINLSAGNPLSSAPLKDKQASIELSAILPSSSKIEGFKDRILNSQNEFPTAPAVELRMQEQTSLSVLLKNERISQLKSKYEALKLRGLSTDDSPYFKPERRICGFGLSESLSLHERAKKDIFITQEEIVDVHPMKILPNSPFYREDGPWMKEILDSLMDEQEWNDRINVEKKDLEAIAVTATGKHIVLQLAVQSCGPSCAAMLLLDRGKLPDYESIRYGSLESMKKVAQRVKKAGLECRVLRIPEKSQAIEWLSQRLAEHGPGILQIFHPIISGHFIVLDEVSIENNEAVIRDSFHGWMITIKLDVLNTWIHGGKFLQIIG